MKTKHLDNEIQRLNIMERTKDLSDYGHEMLNEFRAIRQALTIPIVVGQGKQLVCPECQSTDCKTAIHTDYTECNKCYHYWDAN